MLTATPQTAGRRPGAGGLAPSAIARPLVLALLALALLAITTPARAGATVASGALSQLSEPSSCIGELEEEIAKCGTTVPYGLSSAYQVQVSPDGENAYSVADNGDLIEYSRDLASGALTVIGCFGSLSRTEPCAAGHAVMEVAALVDPDAIAISPDGASVYVVTRGASNVVEFNRNFETGLLSKVGCITHEASSSECATTAAKGLDLPSGVVVSPDGESVYVTGFGEEALAEFTRSGDGVLTQLAAPNECIGGAGSTCATHTAIGLKEDVGIAVSPDPDDNDVYVAAGARGADGDIAAFVRGAEGALAQLPGEAACIGETVAGCTKGSKAEHIHGSEDLVVSPDGGNVYASSFSTNAVVELARTDSGALEQLASPNECVSTEALTGCEQVVKIGGALGVAISPDGADLYATGASEDAVAAFQRGAAGALEQLAANPCLTEQASGCGGPEFDERVGLRFARRLTVSPDGTNVYVAGEEAHAIAELARTVIPTAVRVNRTHGSPAGGAEVYIKGSGFAAGAEVLFGGIRSPAVVVASATSMVAESPALGREEAVAVTVENEAGTSVAGPGDQFTYTERPAVAGVAASVGTEAGGTVVTITGSELLGASGVDFGGTPAAGFTVSSAESITATSPPGTGVVDVTVETPHGASAAGAGDKFTYVHGSPTPVSVLALSEYCAEVGYPRATLENDAEYLGAGFAYENWACVESDGTEVPIANTGPAPSMANACELEDPGVAVYAYPEEPDNAFSWGCNSIVPPEEDLDGGGVREPFVGLPIASGSATEEPAAAVPPPKLAVSANLAPVSGSVLVKLPGSSAFVSLTSVRQVPFGTVVDATDGRVAVTTVTRHGALQAMTFSAGELKLTQGRNGMVVATLAGGSFSVCPTARERSHIARAAHAGAARASGKHVVRKLWAEGHGSYSTRGSYAAGAGARWLTEDRCDGTLIHVPTGSAAVTNLVDHRHATVRAGRSYLAKAP
jgi:DNA-binding beta-propeller fold protein YncE